MLAEKLTHSLGRRTAHAAAYIWIAVCCIWLFRQAYSYGPTDDPDPDGYVTYAVHLQAGEGLLEWRRLPGYPALLAFIDKIGSASLHQDVFVFQIALAVLFLAVSSYVLCRVVGPVVACAYAAILAGPGYFARQSGVMVPDFIAALLLYGIVLVLLAALKAESRGGKAAWSVVLLVFLFCAQLVHPSTDKRVMILAIAILIAALTVRIVRQPYPFGSARNAALIAACLMAASVGANFFSLAFQSRIPLSHFDYDAVHRSSSNLYEGWTLYRMLLCLPPAGESDVDKRIEAVKQRISERQGYRTDLSTPASFAPEFKELTYEVNIPMDGWHSRLAANPLSLGRCMASEVKRRYHHVLSNFLPFNSHVAYLSGPRPPQDGSEESEIYWSTGIDIRGKPGDARAAFTTEVLRCILSTGLLLGGLVLIERKFPYWGMIAALWAAGWTLALLTVQAMEMRYFVPLLPAIALGQAFVLHWILRTTLAVIRRSRAYVRP
jgi:hypothetical protein